MCYMYLCLVFIVNLEHMFELEKLDKKNIQVSDNRKYWKWQVIAHNVSDLNN